MSADQTRPEWSDVTAWQERENRRKARADALDKDVVHYSSDERWDFSDFKAILAFEGEGHRNMAKKEDLIRRHFKVSAARYYQRLLQVISMPEALQHDPGLVHRLKERFASALRNGSTR